MPDELRLLYAIVLNGVVLAGAYRFAARRGSGQLDDTLVDAGLLYLLIQYVAVGLCGLLGILNPLTIGGVALVAAAALWSASRAAPAVTEPDKTSRTSRKPAIAPAATVPSTAILPLEHGVTRWIACVVVIFAWAFLASLVYAQRLLAPIYEDVLTYHLPAAAQWLRTGVIGLLPTWFFNPANTYSPLAGSVLAAWWLAPIGSDYLARYVQLPALVLVFVAMRQIARALGTTRSVALMIAAAAIACRSFIIQAGEPNDDVLLCACFLCVIGGCMSKRLREPLGPWRVGAALGLMLATKYTALYSLFTLLLVADAPFRAGMEAAQWLTAAAAVLLLAGPWYLRNAILTGNPLYPLQVSVMGHPVLRGLLHTHRSPELTTAAGVWSVIVTHYRSPGPALLAVLAAAWVWALVASLRARSRPILHDPLTRLCIVGPVVGVGLFLFTSPYPEVRFVLPSILLMFGCCAMGLGDPRLTKMPLVACLIAAGIALLAALTAFRWELVSGLLPHALLFTAVGVALAVLTQWAGRKIWWTRDRRVMVAGFAGLALASWLYVEWKATLSGYRDDAVSEAWKRWGERGEAWTYVQDNVPPTATLAYCNDHLIYPLMGPRYTRTVVYVPTRPGITRISDLPPFPVAVDDRNMIPTFTESLWQDSDQTTWLARLRASRATFIFIAHPGKASAVPPEMGFATHNPATFQLMFQNDDASIFRIAW